MAIIYVNRKMVHSACSRSLVAMVLEFGLGYLTQVWNQVSNTSGSNPWLMDVSNLEMSNWYQTVAWCGTSDCSKGSNTWQMEASLSSLECGCWS